jgi:integrase
MSLEGLSVARSPKPWYSRGAWRTDFGGQRNRVLIAGPKTAETRLQAEKALLALREEARLLRDLPQLDTPFAVVVERFLAEYEGRPVYTDFCNELHWFMGADPAALSDPGRAPTRRGRNRPSGGRFGYPCKSWPIRRINASLVEEYLRRRKKAGLRGFHPFVALRTLMNWAVRRKYLPSHDLDGIDPALRRRGRRRYIPEDADVVKAYQAARGRFRDVLLALMVTSVRPKELRTVTVDEFDRVNRQWVLWRHKVVEKTGQPKVVALGSDELFDLCVAAAGDRPRDEPLFLTERGRPWTYQAMRLRWRKLRAHLGLDKRFTLYTFRHWYLTVAVESGEDGEIVSELAGQSDRASLDFYKKIRNHRLHQASRRVAATIARAGIAGGSAPEPVPQPGEPEVASGGEPDEDDRLRASWPGPGAG